MKKIIAITVDHLSRSFGAARALDDLSMDFEPGLLHGIIGPDGAGKTTLLRIIAGLLHPSSGGILYSSDGAPVSFEEVRPSIAYMPSSASLYPDLSIREHLEFFRRLYRIPPPEFSEKASRLLAITRLEKFQDRRVGRLSGGMYKKAGLMCALLSSPGVLLLDEPTNGVDPISRREFWELLYGLSGRKILMLISTAYMDEAERCGRVHLLDDGKLIRSGEPGEILRSEGIGSFDELFLRGARRG